MGAELFELLLWGTIRRIKPIECQCSCDCGCICWVGDSGVQITGTMTAKYSQLAEGLKGW